MAFQCFCVFTKTPYGLVLVLLALTCGTMCSVLDGLVWVSMDYFTSSNKAVHKSHCKTLTYDVMHCKYFSAILYIFR